MSERPRYPLLISLGAHFTFVPVATYEAANLPAEAGWGSAYVAIVAVFWPALLVSAAVQALVAMRIDESASRWSYPWYVAAGTLALPAGFIARFALNPSLALITQHGGRVVLGSWIAAILVSMTIGFGAMLLDFLLDAVTALLFLLKRATARRRSLID